MKNRFTLCFKSKIVPLFFSAVLLMSFSIDAQDLAAGEKLFKQNCAACHKIDKKLVGPALGGVTERRDAEWLLSWIRNNQALRESGDAEAIAIYKEYNGSAMPAYPQFKDEDIQNILAYVEDAWAVMQTPPVEAAAGGAAGGVSGPATPQIGLVPVLAGIVVFLMLMVFILLRIKNALKILRGEEARSLVDDTFAFFEWLQNNKKYLVLGAIVLAIFGVRALWFNLTSIGVAQGYQPVQPIAFSHELHAGQNQIDCNYCHSSARHSAHSGIPSANVCMNCHMYIAEGPEYGTTEIQKIYDAVGWDSEKRAYIEGYEEKPIEWVRIHNLPDLAYFNHSQHVVAGGLDCQTCHGPIETMKEVYQYSPLTMGWCINCHRETEVQVADNAYYDKLHAQLKDKYEGEKITVEMIGGLECGKCHY